MIRGTTPTLEFMLPFETQTLAEAYITIAQQNSTVIEKNLAECTSEGSKITVTLSQEETLKLNSGMKAEIQIRCRTTEGEVLASNIIIINADRILKDGVI